MSDVRAWLETQDAYTLHRTVMKHFSRNPYNVKNVIDVWKCDLLEVQSLAKHNDMQRNYNGHRRILEISSSGPYKVKVCPIRRLGVSVHISRRLAQP